MIYHPAILLAAVGVCLTVISAWMHIKNQDGSGRAIAVTLFLITSCSKA